MRPTTKAMVSALFFALASISLGADWPNFRGPKFSAQSDERGLPTKWSGDDNIAWKTKLPGPGASSPITHGDKIFLTSYSGYGVDRRNAGEQKDLKRHLVCVDRAKGTILWDKATEAKLPESRYQGFITGHGYASSTPATDGERVFVFYGKTGVLAYDFQGKQLWQKNVGTGLNRMGWGSGSSPILYKNLVIVNAAMESESIVALDKATGKEMWKIPKIRSIWGTPILVDVEGGKQELVINLIEEIAAFDPATGKDLWNCDGIQGSYVCTTQVARDGIVYAIGGLQSMCLAVKAGGKGDVTKSRTLWSKRGGSNVCSPVVHGDHMYWVNDRGIAYCLKMKDGEKVYEKRLEGGGQFYSSAMVADGKIYAVSRTGTTYVLAAKPEFELLAKNTIETDKSTCNASPTPSKGQLLLRTDQFLYCIGKK